VSNANPIRNRRRGPKPQHHPGYLRLIALLRETRIKRGWTQRDVAERLRKPPSYVHKGETGSRRLDFREVVEWCAAIELDVGDAVRIVRR
jgi:transcriptional regulator with XRE-family HTH domain